MDIAPDLFAWAETRPTATVIDATYAFQRRMLFAALTPPRIRNFAGSDAPIVKIEDFRLSFLPRAS
ncbi:hypothetical protein [Shinella granuli]|uniref:Uncharacterized protein n=1 Tax=Shinella granuli TaxID=323621 RepID=A0A4R2D4R5_SHIGR|nr:hypothetical protein [Shinella granuli]TCN46874.1 hypothetical protein EV665_10342 [Shinella granuli]